MPRSPSHIGPSRRQLIASLGAASAASSWVPTAYADEPWLPKPGNAPRVAFQENEHVAIEVRADASASLTDKNSGTVWRMGRVALQEYGGIDEGLAWPRSERWVHEQFPGRFAVTALADNRLHYTLIGRQQRPQGRFICELKLDGPFVVFRLLQIDESLNSLVFPPPLESESLVLPRGVGQWVRKPLEKRLFLTMYGHLNQRFFGGLRGDAGWLAVFSEGHPDAGVMATQLAASPGWLKSLGRWSYPREVRYRFTSDGYVGIAHAFRDWAKSKNLLRPLTDKLAETPALNNLWGGRLLSIYQAQTQNPLRREDQLAPFDAKEKPSFKIVASHDRAREALAEAQKLGVQQALAVVRGWISGGYDYSHPDVWPPDPRLGSTAELKQLLALPDPITVALHDNYMDIYEHVRSFPRGVIRRPNGQALVGGQWAGGQAYILNSRNAVAYAQRNWDKLHQLAPRAMFIDTTTAVMLYESYEQGNHLSRSQDQQQKELLLAFYKSHKLVLGSEEGVDFGVRHVDWLENRHKRVAGESIPLWPLVFHDSVFCTRYSHNAPAELPGSGILPDLLWGYPLLHALNRQANANAWNADAIKAGGVVDEWHRRVGTAMMTKHHYLSDDFEVEESQFSSGHAVVCNFSTSPKVVEGHTIAPGAYWFRT